MKPRLLRDGSQARHRGSAQDPAQWRRILAREPCDSPKRSAPDGNRERLGDRSVEGVHDLVRACTECAEPKRPSHDPTVNLSVAESQQRVKTCQRGVKKPSRSPGHTVRTDDAGIAGPTTSAPHRARTLRGPAPHDKENTVLDLVFIALTVLCFSLVAFLGEGADRL